MGAWAEGWSRESAGSYRLGVVMAERARTHICVPIMCEDVESALRASVRASEAGADLIEYRVDELFDPGGGDSSVREVSALVARSPVPCVVTCRPVREGGGYEGEDGARLGMMRALCESDDPPRFLDVELSTIEGGGEAWSALSAALAGGGGEGVGGVRPSLIVSTHDFEGRPRDLMGRLASMRGVRGGRVVKVAYRARSLRDNLEVFEILCERDRPTIALGMGEFGLMSRVLAPKFGGFLTFASVPGGSGTAPGQPAVEELIDRYRFRSIGAGTRVFGVVGWPVAQSRSPELHNAAFGRFGVDGVYLPMPVPAEWEHFKATVGALVSDGALGIGGLSVTIPHKVHAVRLARELGWEVDGSAARAGAANTISVGGDGAVRVGNTDGVAARLCLEDALGGSVAGRRVAVIGAGGVARGIVSALIGRGARITVFNRTLARAAELVESVGGRADEGDEGGAEIVARELASLGLACGGAEGASPSGEGVVEGLGGSTVFMDTVYTPVETPFLRLARERGVDTVDGWSMFIRQASLQFEGWTGVSGALGVFEEFV